MEPVTKKYEIDEAAVEATYKDAEVSIVLTIKDGAVIPPLDLENKKKMSQLTQIIASNLIATIGNPNFSKGPIRGGMSQPPPANCPKCEAPLKY